MIKSKLVTGLIVVIVILSAIMALSWIAILDKQKEIERLNRNQEQLLSDRDDANERFQLTLDEFRKSVKKDVDSIMKANKIKDRQLQDVTNVYNYYNSFDTTIVRPNPLVVDRDTIYPFTISKDCYTIAGNMRVIKNQPELAITQVSQSDSIRIFGYWDRPHKFLGIKYGKKENYVKGVSNCGETTVQRIDIKKRR